MSDAVAVASATPQGQGTQAATAAALTVAAYEKKHYRAQVLAAFAVLLIIFGGLAYLSLVISSQAYSEGKNAGWNLFSSGSADFGEALTAWAITEPFGANSAGFNVNTGELVLLVTGIPLILLGVIMGGFRGVFVGAFGVLFLLEVLTRYLTGKDFPSGLGDLPSVNWASAFGA